MEGDRNLLGLSGASSWRDSQSPWHLPHSFSRIIIRSDTHAHAVVGILLAFCVTSQTSNMKSAHWQAKCFIPRHHQRQVWHMFPTPFLPKQHPYHTLHSTLNTPFPCVLSPSSSLPVRPTPKKKPSQASSPPQITQSREDVVRITINQNTHKSTESFPWIVSLIGTEWLLSCCVSPSSSC